MICPICGGEFMICVTKDKGDNLFMADLSCKRCGTHFINTDWYGLSSMQAMNFMKDWWEIWTNR